MKKINLEPIVDQDLYFVSKSAVSCSFPHQQPKNLDGSLMTEWSRSNGKSKLTLKGSLEFGLPSGRDRLFGIFLKTKSLQTKSPVVHFKDCSSILKELGLSPKGNNLVWLHNVINRFTSTIIAYEEGDKFKGGSFEGSLILKAVHGFFDNKEEKKESSYFVLGDVFFNVPGVPIDLKVFKKLGRHWMASDLYFFITHRLYQETKNSNRDEDLSKRKPLRIKMSDYKEQCGVPLMIDNKTFRQFLKKSFVKIKSVGHFDISLDEKDVLTVPICRPRLIHSYKRQEIRKNIRKVIDALSPENDDNFKYCN